jgi:hypothetical protein
VGKGAGVERRPGLLMRSEVNEREHRLIMKSDSVFSGLLLNSKVMVRRKGFDRRLRLIEEGKI